MKKRSIYDYTPSIDSNISHFQLSSNYKLPEGNIDISEDLKLFRIPFTSLREHLSQILLDNLDYLVPNFTINAYTLEVYRILNSQCNLTKVLDIIMKNTLCNGATSMIPPSVINYSEIITSLSGPLCWTALSKMISCTNIAFIIYNCYDRSSVLIRPEKYNEKYAIFKYDRGNLSLYHYKEL